MGNWLCHQYDAIELPVVWKTVRDDLPPLKAAVLRTLAPPSEGSGTRLFRIAVWAESLERWGLSGGVPEVDDFNQFPDFVKPVVNAHRRVKDGTNILAR